MENAMEGVIGYCYICEGEWGSCSCPEISHEHYEGFSYDGMWITNPCVSECSRFLVDPVVYYGADYIKWLAKEPTLWSALLATKKTPETRVK